MVEIFKTNVNDSESALRLIGQLSAQYPHFKIKFDLDDCDRILRVAGEGICTSHFIEILESAGFECELIE